MKRLYQPLVEIVVSVAYAWRATDTPFLLPFRPRFIAHRARSDSIALAGYPAQKEFKARLRRQNKKDTRRCLFVLAEKERFESASPTTRVACRELSPALARLCSLALWLLRFAKTILTRFCSLALAGYPARFKSLSEKKRDRPKGSVSFFVKGR